jgi:Flp pilus assembly protein TadG
MRKFFQRAIPVDPESPAPSRKARTGLAALLGDECGAIMVETTLGFMILMTMVLGILECSMMAYTYSVMEDSAREGVRYASVHGTDSSTCQGPSTGCDSTAASTVADVKAYAGTFTSGLSTMTVTVTYPDGLSTATSRVKVALSVTYQPIFHIPETAHLMQVSSTGRILY